MQCLELDERTRVILLLTAEFHDTSAGKHRALTFVEWGRFAAWMHKCGETPERLLQCPRERLGGLLQGSPIGAARVEHLLGRGHLLDSVLSVWGQSGIWVLPRSSEEYPKQLKVRLGNNAPPVLYGAGCTKILSDGGVGVVGSRNADPAELEFATHLGAFLGANRIAVVSGAARGVDEKAMFGALDHNGQSVGVIGGGLLDKLKATKYQTAVGANLLTLVTPYAPEIKPLNRPHFVARLMGRNRFIYGLSRAAIVVASEREKGGTWAGAVTALNDRWLPIWCFPSKKNTSGFMPLMERGAMPLSQDIQDLIVRMPLSDETPGPGVELDPLVYAITRGGPIEVYRQPPLMESIRS